VQTGFGRTGAFLGGEVDGVMPDACSLAKGIAGGFPMGAILLREKLNGALPPGTHASTFGGNALAAAAGIAVLDIFAEENVIENVIARGHELSEACRALAGKFPKLVSETRGRGLLQGVALRAGVDPAGVLGKVREQNVLCTLAGGNVLRISPALTITADELAEGMARVAAAFESIAQEMPA
jgi:acetylornithine/N-succinyldiaminopimelate aminotransferase